MAVQVWLSGVDPFVQHVLDPTATSDYMDLFKPEAPWGRAAALVKVFKTSAQFVQNASDSQLTQMFAGLRQRHIALALVGLMLTGPRTCGKGVEGYATANEMRTLAARVRKLGGDLQYIAMDEPLWFGHVYRGHNACGSSMTAVAQDAAAQVAAIRSSFPSVRVGDIEPIGVQEPADYMGEIAQWLRAYRTAERAQLAFFQVDVQWDGPWHQQLEQLVPLLHADGIKFGIIYNGNSDDQTDLAWTQHAEEHFVAVESDPTLIPDQAIFQSWMKYPRHLLPETQPGTMTWLIDRYGEKEIKIALNRQGRSVVGQLTDMTGQPVAGARVQITAVMTAGLGAPTVAQLTGAVPMGATHALLALRINSECECSGPADVTIGTMQYRDGRSGQLADRTFNRVGGAVAAGGVRFIAHAGQQIQQNTPSFSVTAGDPFTMRIPMRASYASRESGYVALIFQGPPGKPGVRFLAPFAPATTPLGVATTNAQGRFSFVPSAGLLQSNPSFRAEFAGNDQARMASAFLP